MSELKPPLAIGTRTPWGKVAAVCLTGGERYYQCLNRHGVVALMPADAVEPAVAQDGDLRKCYDRCCEDRSALEAERDRLREALEKCARPSAWHAPCITCGEKIVEQGCYIARAALQEDK